MAGSRTLKLSILADVDNLKKELDKGSKEVEGFGGKLDGFAKKAGAAFLAAGAAAAAYAGKLAIEGVKAAIEDEAAQERLANALRNVTAATDTQIAAVEKQILKTSLATGVADNQLRPAYQRLAIATGDLTKSSDLLTLALDISAATGKDVESVANALGKAYEGNTGALTRLGVGLSAAEIKTLGLEGAISTLSDTFGGAAATQAETYQGKIARVQVAFDEAKETIGTALLPIIEKLMKFIVETAIPKFQEFKASSIDPVIKAFKDNEDTLRDLVEFAQKYLIPLVTFQLKQAFKGIATLAPIIVDAFEIAIKSIIFLVNTAISSINLFIRAKNLLTGGPDTPLLNKITFGSSTDTGGNTVKTASLPAGVTITTPKTPTVTTPKTPVVTQTPGVVTSQGNPSVTVPNVVGVTNFNAGSFRRGEEASMAGITINVNSPSVIDEDGFTRAVVQALNNTQARSGGGGGQLVL